ncbi:MAG: pyruvate carboxyltransferase [Desulfamplus sp.]|nr:pyruvate carboxyltransferase [Desulfamplus sp.]
MPEEYRIIDSTLREGEQTPGVSFTIDQKKNILNRLAKIGVSEAEIGIASPLIGYLDDIFDYCRTDLPSLKISLWSRCKEDDIRYAAKLKPDILSLSIPTSDLHLKAKFNKTRKWAKNKLSDSINFARELGLRVSVGFEDATRADIEFITELVIIASDNGAERIRLADTVGISSPKKISNLVKSVKNINSKCQIAVHTHNDFGMATANAVAALESGATWADATVLGLGERSGCARLEELAVYLTMQTKYCKMSIQYLKELSTYVASIASLSIERGRPIVGNDIFTCETGLHLHGLQKNVKTYEPYPPESVGAERRFIFGAKSGCQAIKL